jgi:hypothetical protein
VSTRFIPVKKLRNGHFEMESQDNRQYNNVAGYRYTNDEGANEFMILPKPFRDEICSGLIFKNVVGTLVERGFLMVESDGTPQVRRRLPNMDQLRVYHFNSSILGEGEVLEAATETEDQQ